MQIIKKYEIIYSENKIKNKMNIKFDENKLKILNKKFEQLNISIKNN